jgi:hypothetical protein
MHIFYIGDVQANLVCVATLENCGLLGGYLPCNILWILDHTFQIFDANLQFNYGCKVGNVILLSLQK